jgi:hypothetical protein
MVTAERLWSLAETSISGGLHSGDSTEEPRAALIDGSILKSCVDHYLIFQAQSLNPNREISKEKQNFLRGLHPDWAKSPLMQVG